MATAAVLATVEALGAADVARADSTGCSVLLGDVRRVRGWLDAVEARVTARVSELSMSSGSAPAADVHVRAGGVSAGEGRRKERRAEVLGLAPVFANALESGEVGAEHVDVLANTVAQLDEQVKASLLDRQDALVAVAGVLSPEQFGRHVRTAARSLEAASGVERNTRQRRDTFLSRRVDLASGMVEGRFAFHPELAAQIFGPIDREVAAMIAEGERRGDRDCLDRSVNRNRLAAEALGRLVAGGHQQVRPVEAEILVIVDAHTLATGQIHDHSVCETGDGLDLPLASVTRLFCNGRVAPIIVRSDGTVLDAGRTIRNANRAQRRALRAMYRTCAFDGCEVGFARCEIHHIHWFEHGGATDLVNLVPLCARHHHLVHDLGWKLHLEPDRTLVITRPDGSEHARTRPDVPPRTRRLPARSPDRPTGRPPMSPPTPPPGRRTPAA